LKDIPPTKIATFSLARKYLRDILDKRESTREFGWTLCLMPTPALAENAALSMEDYTAQIVRASYLDEPDPVAAWEGIFQQAEGVKEWLNGMDVEHYHVQSASTDSGFIPDNRGAGSACPDTISRASSCSCPRTTV
jgi:Thermophilic metalloprotease (M29).